MAQRADVVYHPFASIRDPNASSRKMCAGTKCRNPGSNQGPPDLQSDALPTELLRLLIRGSHKHSNSVADVTRFAPHHLSKDPNGILQHTENQKAVLGFEPRLQDSES
jgi:hypothetical protein